MRQQRLGLFQALAGLHLHGGLDVGRPQQRLEIARRLVRAPLEEPELDQLYRETEGNPLFVVEALRSGWKPGLNERGQSSAKIKAVIDSRPARMRRQARCISQCQHALRCAVRLFISAYNHRQLYHWRFST